MTARRRPLTTAFSTIPSSPACAGPWTCQKAPAHPCSSTRILPCRRWTSAGSPYRTFDSIRRFAELLSQSRGERFLPRVTNCRLTDETALTLIEPPCGSNTAILTHGEDVLFIDSGYACYRPEMLTLFRRLVPNFDARKKTILITHADVDHCGLLPEFDEVLLSAKAPSACGSRPPGRTATASAIPCTSPISRSANA